MSAEGASDLLHWFKQQHVVVDTSSMGIVDFADHGRGAIALKDIPVRLLSTRLSRRELEHGSDLLMFTGRLHHL